LIQNLLIQIATLLQTELTQQIEQPQEHIKAEFFAESTAETLPQINLYPGKLEVSQNLRDNSSLPRSQELHQELSVDQTNPTKTYSLTHYPIKESVQCQLIVDYQPKNLTENTDFNIDYQQATITFTDEQNLSHLSKILLDYSFFSVSVLREFQQEFMTDLYGRDRKHYEEILSLIIGIILANQDELIDQYNKDNENQYKSINMITTHSLNQIKLLEGNPVISQNVSGFQLKFQVTGQIQMTKTIPDGISTIKTIRHLGRLTRSLQ
jgi:hypothetical protein